MRPDLAADAPTVTVVSRAKQADGGPGPASAGAGGDFLGGNPVQGAEAQAHVAPDPNTKVGAAAEDVDWDQELGDSRPQRSPQRLSSPPGSEPLIEPIAEPNATPKKE